MKQKLLDVWRWQGWDLVLQVALILVLFGGGMYFQYGEHVLESESCESYWTEFKSLDNISNYSLVAEHPEKQDEKREKGSLKPINLSSETSK